MSGRVVPRYFCAFVNAVYAQLGRIVEEYAQLGVLEAAGERAGEVALDYPGRLFELGQQQRVEFALRPRLPARLPPKLVEMDDGQRELFPERNGERALARAAAADDKYFAIGE